jgi:RNA polymerase sigma factor (sigma-70 family)
MMDRLWGVFRFTRPTADFEFFPEILDRPALLGEVQGKEKRSRDGWMRKSHSSPVLRELHVLFSAGTQAGLTDDELLARFIAREGEVAEQAFAALVERHGPMVFRICRRVLVDPHKTEDAFQATFLILVRKAGTLRDRDSVGNWLYGVACRVAAKARTLSSRRQHHERRYAEGLQAFPRDEDPDREDLEALLHQEVGRLPARYRIPVVLCYLQGATQEEAANRLGWPIGTVRSRLARAREQLRGRLTRRGIVLPATGLVSALAGDAPAVMPQGLVDCTVTAALTFVGTGATAAGAVPASVEALMQGVLRTMLMTKLKITTGVLIALGMAATSAGVFAYQEAPGNNQLPLDANFAVTASNDQEPSDRPPSPAANNRTGDSLKSGSSRRGAAVGEYLERMKREVNATVKELETEVADLRAKLEQAEANLKRMKTLQTTLNGINAIGVSDGGQMPGMMRMMGGGMSPSGSQMSQMMRGMMMEQGRGMGGAVTDRPSEEPRRGNDVRSRDRSEQQRREALDREIRRLTEERTRLDEMPRTK